MSKKRLKKQTCYMCARPATTKEHVPPKCFFPKKEDLPDGLDYRKNLAPRIPSCHLHNTANPKTQDDEFLQITLVVFFGNNLVAQRDATKRMIRAIKERPSLLRLITTNPQLITVDGQETITYEIDRPRFDKAILNVARAIYYREYRDKLTENVKGKVLTPSLSYSGEKALQHNSTLLETLRKVEQFFVDKELPKKGIHPEVFYYQLHREKEDKRKVAIKMVFYEGCVIYMGFDPDWH